MYAHLVDLGQALEHHVTQLMGRDGRQCARAQLDLDVIDNLIELLSVDIALDGGAHQADKKLIAIEPLLSSI